MLYALHELRHNLGESANYFATTTRQLLDNPLNPFNRTVSGRMASAWLEMLERGTRRYRKPEFGIAEVGGRPVREEIPLRLPFCDLLRFAVEGREERETVLVVAPLSGHHATLLRGTVEGLLPHHDVLITDWIDARLVPEEKGPFTLDDYIDDVIAILRHLGRRCHVVAVCQPAVPVFAAACLMAADRHDCRPLSLALMGGPIDPRQSPQAPNLLATTKPISWFERNAIMRVPFNWPGHGRRVYPGFLQLSGFMAMNMDRHIDAHLSLFEHLVEGDGESAERHRAFYDEYLAVMDLPAEYYLETVKRVFQDHALPKGEFLWRGVRVDASAIEDIDILVVEGENDDISGVGQTKAALELCRRLPAGRKRYHLEPGVGHYGIFNGRHWREAIRPELTKMVRRAQRRAGARAPGPAS